MRRIIGALLLLLKEPVAAGPKKGAVNRLHEMLPEYYQLRGWTADGKVPEEKKQAIGLTK
jgi:aldehyde:ferredoxin oxidoreductase